MTSGRPNCDGCYGNFSAGQSNIQKLKATTIQSTVVDTDSLYIGGVPLLTYLEGLGVDVNRTVAILTPVERKIPEKVEKSVPIFPVFPPSQETTEPQIIHIPVQLDTVQHAQRANHAELADRASQAHRADVASRIEDPVGAHQDYIMTSDDYGRGSWKPAPQFRFEPSDSIQARIFKFRHKTARAGHILVCTDEKTGNAEWIHPRELENPSNTFVGYLAGNGVHEGTNNVAIGNSSGPIQDFSNTISLGMGAVPRQNGDIALGSEYAPVQMKTYAVHGNLEIVAPTSYLSTVVNGRPYKLALYS